jgi:hypothetical protein
MTEMEFDEAPSRLLPRRRQGRTRAASASAPRRPEGELSRPRQRVRQTYQARELAAFNRAAATCIFGPKGRAIDPE